MPDGFQAEIVIPALTGLWLLGVVILDFRQRENDSWQGLRRLFQHPRANGAGKPPNIAYKIVHIGAHTVGVQYHISDLPIGLVMLGANVGIVLGKTSFNFLSSLGSSVAAA